MSSFDRAEVEVALEGFDKLCDVTHAWLVKGSGGFDVLGVLQYVEPWSLHKLAAVAQAFVDGEIS